MEKRKCFKCRCKYERNSDMKYSDNDNTYCKYLGTCSKKCMDKLSDEFQNELYLSSFLNHYWSTRDGKGSMKII
jgi:hypothetical protein